MWWVVVGRQALQGFQHGFEQEISSLNLYSGIGVGYAMQIEAKHKARNVWHTFAAQATLLGISVGKGHWFGSFEAGALFTGRSFPDRCFTFSLGFRF